MKRILAGFLSFALAAVSHALSFSDIQNWTGSGGNEAAMVVDWYDGKQPESLVWGYRWNGTATGEDMLRAIVASDPHLYVKVSDQTPYGVALFGIGYDTDGNGLSLDSGETFTNRTIVADYSHADGAHAVDPADHYQEGWYSGYWSYYVAETDGTIPGGADWQYSGAGMSGRILQNGSCDGWAYDAAFSGVTPENPTPAAVPEPDSLATLGLGLLALRRRRRQ